MTEPRPPVSTGDHQTSSVLTTTDLSDALDRLGIATQVRGISPLSPRFEMRGRAFTVRYGPKCGRGGTVGDFIDDVEPGSTVVLDNRGRRDATVWGDLLTAVARRNRLAGAVIDGVCRDTKRIRQTAFPVFSRGAFMRTGKDRVIVDAVQEVVTVGEVSVAPGDLVVGDADGVVVIPAAHESCVLEIAEQIREAEGRIRSALAAGEPLRSAREAVGYHRLQGGTRTGDRKVDP